MMRKPYASLIVLITACMLGTSPVHATAWKDSTLKKPSANPRDLMYKFYYKVLSSDKHPADEIMIDSTGEMRFNTHQQMKAGMWKRPDGFAYIEIPDDDTLSFFLRKESIFEIDPSDISPQCPDGDILFFSIYRGDLKKQIQFKTNTCAMDYNLLTGEQRKLFPMFIAFVQRLANRYRPQFPD